MFLFYCKRILPFLSSLIVIMAAILLIRLQHGSHEFRSEAIRKSLEKPFLTGAWRVGLEHLSEGSTWKDCSSSLSLISKESLGFFCRSLWSLYPLVAAGPLAVCFVDSETAPSVSSLVRSADINLLKYFVCFRDVISLLWNVLFRS